MSGQNDRTSAGRVGAEQHRGKAAVAPPLLPDTSRNASPRPCGTSRVLLVGAGAPLSQPPTVLMSQGEVSRASINFVQVPRDGAFNRPIPYPRLGPLRRKPKRAPGHSGQRGAYASTDSRLSRAPPAPGRPPPLSQTAGAWLKTSASAIRGRRAVLQLLICAKSGNLRVRPGMPRTCGDRGV